MRLFGGTGGLAEKMQAAADAIVGSNGSIQKRTDGLQDTVDSLQDQYDRTKAAIKSTLDNYRAPSTRPDALVAQVHHTSNYTTHPYAATPSQICTYKPTEPEKT